MMQPQAALYVGDVGRGLSWPGWLQFVETERAKGLYLDLMDPVDIAEEAVGEAVQIQPAEAKSEPPNNSPAIVRPKSLRLRRATERINVDRASGILGLSIRTVQKMAQAGELAGAAKMGRRWTFNEDKLRAYVRNKERQTWQSQKHRQDVTGVKTSSGVAPRSKAKPSDGRFTQAIQKLRRNAGLRAKSGR
jgi:excisionase family DNA binding protein